MRSNRLIIPRALRSDVLRQLHHPHTGVTKMKLRAAATVYWPCMDPDIEATVAACHLCQRDRPANPRQPMVVTQTPPLPWHTVYMDLSEYERENFLVVADAYSFYWEIVKVRNLTMHEMARALFSVF